MMISIKINISDKLRTNIWDIVGRIESYYLEPYYDKYIEPMESIVYALPDAFNPLDLL